MSALFFFQNSFVEVFRNSSQGYPPVEILLVSVLEGGDISARIFANVLNCIQVYFDVVLDHPMKSPTDDPIADDPEEFHLVGFAHFITQKSRFYKLF